MSSTDRSRKRPLTKTAENAKTAKKVLLAIPKVAISKFAIKGLFGDRDVSVSFNNGVKIIVGDNGSGKTTILNALYFILAGKFHRLTSIPFESISITFPSKVIVEVFKKELPTPYAWALKSPFLGEYRDSLSEEEFLDSVKLFQETTSDRDFYFAIGRRGYEVKIQNGFTFHRALAKAWDSWTSSDKSGSDITADLKKKYAIIEAQFPSPIMFLPTFRRIEEEMTNLGLHLEKDDPRRAVKDSQIFFGMRDVDQLFISLREKIRKTTYESYMKTSREMVNQLINKGFQVDITQLQELRDEQSVSLVLKRLGKTLGTKRKDELKAFLDGEQNANSDVSVLAYTLKNLMSVYTELRPIEEQIRAFVEITNKYLTGKSLSFDEVSAEILLVDQNNKPMRLQQLSSGEKQLVSILSRIHLTDQKSFALVLDEPELSLSLEWQKTLLPDLLRSKKCVFLIAATHSPFIFDNELDPYASIVTSTHIKAK